MHTQAVDPDAARRDAQHILSDRRFHRDPAPRPLRGPVRWIGDRIQSLTNWVSDVISKVPAVVWLGIVIVIVTLVVTRIIVVSQRRRTSAPVAVGGAQVDSEASEDPAELERLADEAEDAGDLARSIRLRFRAGLLRLGDRRVITYRPSLTTSEVRRALGSETFDELARTFEAVAYGGRDAQKSDVDSARREWPRVVKDAAPR